MTKNKSKIFLLILSLTIAFNMTLFTNSLIFKSNAENLNDTNIDLNELKVSGSEINIITPENKTYTEPMSGYYPATYGFENDKIGDDPDEWTIWMEEDIIEVVSEVGGHKNVLRLYDSSISTQNHINQEFSTKDHGQIECWVRTTDVNDLTSLSFETSASVLLFRFRIDGGSFEIEDGSGVQSIASASNNQWYHVKIVFRGSYGSSYESLSSTFTWKAFIDGTEYGSYTFVNNQDMELFRPGTANVGASGVNFYIDAVGYSWGSDYTIGDNLNEGLLLSYSNNTSLDWMGCSLNSQTNRTILGNTTIPFPTIDGVHTIQVFGNDSLGTNYHSDVRYFTTNVLNIVTPENKTYYGPMSGYYPATYGFENDEIGDDPDEWTIWMEEDIIEVVSEVGGHKNVLRLYDSSISTQNHINQEFSAKDHGQIECWVRTTDVNDLTSLSFETSASVLLFRFRIDGGSFEREDGSGVQSIASASNNQWYHVKIVFRGSYGSSYESLSSTFTWKAFIDGTEYGSYTFVNNQDMELFRPGTANVGASGVNFYIDAVGYSWGSDYTIGDNLNEGLLLSYTNSTSLDWVGYSLDSQTNRTMIGNTAIPLPTEGSHSIQIFANNSIGTNYQSDIRYFEIDTSPPVIQINSPDSNQFFGIIAPIYEIFITESHLNTTWYSLNNGITNITFSGLIGTINQTLWDNIIDGDVSMIFYANDTWGFESYTAITIRKETVPPISLISYIPYGGMNFVNISTTFTINTDDGTGSGVSIIRYKINDSSWIDYTGPFDLSSYTYGDYEITYQTIDNVGNIEDEKSIIVTLVEIPSIPPGILGYNIIILVSVLCVITAVIIKKKLNF